MGSHAGFSVLELVLVIAMLAILAVMAMARAGNIVAKTYENSENATIAAIQTSVTIQNAAESIPH